MRLELLWAMLGALTLSFPSPADGVPLQVLSAPNVLRVGSKENVFVEIQDHNGGPVVVTVRVQNHPTKSKKLVEQNVELNAGNQFQSFVEILIPEEDYISMDDRQKQYVYLQAVFPTGTLEKVVLASFQSGYIFIQTDKPLYNPGTSVLFRVLAVTPKMEPLTSALYDQDKDLSIDIDLVTPENITIQRAAINTDKGMKSSDFKLPDIVSPGVWQLVSRFHSTPQRTFTTEFEVKEYVLPSFEVKVEPRKTFFYVDDERLYVDITARYLFGKEVKGVAFVMFGVMKGDSKSTFPSSLQRVEINKGKGEALMKIEHITDSGKQIKDLVSQSIFVTVKVLTESGGEMVEGQKGGIQIVESPYTIHFKHTPRFFKPGMPFIVQVYVTNPDQTPAKGLRVNIGAEGDSAVTNNQGIAVQTVNTQNTQSMAITVKTSDPEIKKEERQATATLHIKPYQSNTKNLLHLKVDTNEKSLHVDMTFGEGPSDMDITILILSKGQLVKSIRKQRSGKAPVISINIEITKHMLPSFRVVAYYHVGSDEVVADSVWVELQTSCMGTLKIQASRPLPSYTPREGFKLVVTGDPGAKVGLLAVDKGVTVLNNKHKLTQKKIWDVVEKYDTGCTPGSGPNSMGVFYDAGLTFETNTARGTNIRTESKCPVTSRRRRAITEFQFRIDLEARYSDLTEKACCVSGMKRNALDYTCVRRAKYINDQDACKQAFLYCCEQMEEQRKKHIVGDLDLARGDEDDASYLNPDEITARSNFPESWMWNEITLPPCAAGDKCETTEMSQINAMPDSITTWQVTAISLSEENAVCVTEPYEMIVLKDFFIDLRLPYSAVYNEQLEVKAVLHNYKLNKIKVRVYLMENENICSSANKKKQYVRDVTVEPESTLVIPYVMIPLTLGEHTITVKASVFDTGIQDGVERVLRVVPPGELMKKFTSVNLDPQGKTQTINLKSGVPENRVPNTPASTEINVIGGDQTSVLVESVVTGSTMGSLIQQPVGCGEQNMIYMTLPVIATRFLDTTRQWEDVGLDKRATAVDYIRLGYQRQAAYVKPDGSYSAWSERPTSTWLTAYVAKVFAMSRPLITIDPAVVCKAVEWLILGAQEQDGRFTEHAPVIHGEMIGDVAGLDTDASMTAFVLIALQEARPVCPHIITLTQNMNKALTYLQNRLPTVKNPYSIAMISYAMANHGSLDKGLLLDRSTGLNHWEVPRGSGIFTLEATAYALLALVKVEALQEAGPVVKWLSDQGRSGGGYGSTQATIMVYQALAEYYAKTHQIKEFDLEVDIKVLGRGKPDQWVFNRRNQFVTRTTKVPDVNQDLTVEARGEGTATVSVLTLYYAVLDNKNPGCSDFELTVEMVKEGKASYPSADASYLLKIKTKYKSSERVASMSVLDIGLLTGFIPDIEDLTKLQQEKDRYIEKFEMDTKLSERGSLIIYLDKVSNTEWEHINFRVHSVDKVGILQPAAVTVYEYYQPTRCRAFYHPQRTDGGLLRLKSKEDEEIYRCAEENCSMQKKQGLDDSSRIEKACEVTKDRSVDYVFKVQLESLIKHPTTDTYTMRILNVIKQGVDKGVMGQLRLFVAFALCRESLDLKEGSSYLLMGVSKDVYKPREGANVDYQYVLGEQTWVEYWPTEEECPKQEYRQACRGLKKLETTMKISGCEDK